MRATVFTEILRHAVQHTPGALGGAFAAEDGETVDAWSGGDRGEWALLTAHFGIVLRQVQAALHTFHFGEAQQIVTCHDRLDVIIQAVAEGYYAVLALGRPSSLAVAMRELDAATVALRQEMC